jgi:hypothetical protein
LTPTESQGSVRMALTLLTYIVEVNTNLPGVRLRAGSRSITSTSSGPARLTVLRPTAELEVTGTLSGHVEATTRVSPASFTLRDGEMVAAVRLDLMPRPAAAPAAPPAARAPAAPRAPRVRRPSSAASGGAAPTPTTEAPPDNPF